MKNYLEKCFIAISILVIIVFQTACKKQDDFLNAKPNDALAVISTLEDCLTLLSADALINLNDPTLGEISTDDLYLTPARWAGLTTFNVPQEQNAYIWAKNIAEPGAVIRSWSLPYSQVYSANVVLDALPNIKYPSSQQKLYNQIKGSALFYRSIAFYNLLQNFSLPYNPINASSTPGIVLRLTSDINVKVTRSTEQVCYEEVIEDLKESLKLLPMKATYLTQPSQTAVNGLLSRIYLSMGDYANALVYADACLKLNNALTDFNTLQPTTYNLSSTYLNEDIYHTCFDGAISLAINFRGNADTTLYKLYTSNDLRKTVFFIIKSALPVFRGTYDFNGYTYSGIATDEIYLNRAECYARTGNTSAAMTDLNILLIKRWKAGTFIPFSASSSTDALSQILLERRKELIFRGLRWSDLRRLNQEQNLAVTLTRTMNGVTYLLPPNDARYAMPLPEDEIQLDGLQQNQR
ncbi:RagB/SusD family nutrient uptake outer membrane protein [Mucilaginibacter jinjuensis]|uniref:RagB/SusD family nutrient uptake outer membrane protein n=1 Tax=Mucilaginibacter jinjuensis TaxID=1176721 RepID=A0ABY7TAC5_9SPHI|nr:RagB/SusD family nutrient uptake outer membrane protein [Mucilaginibacter jinjuensis]WCT13460.1 RagB/SusD family nutrient uptake outer membrane protein [Mucilaginibacter jinjuensis]